MRTKDIFRKREGIPFFVFFILLLSPFLINVQEGLVVPHPMESGANEQVFPDGGTVGSEFTITGSGFGEKIGQVYIGTKRCRVRTWRDDSIHCVITTALISGTHDITIKPKNSPPFSLLKAFTIRDPSIGSIKPSYVLIGDEVTLNGLFFGTKKGRVSVDGKTGKVLRWKMNSISGESEVTFIVPKAIGTGPHEIGLTNAIGRASIEIPENRDGEIVEQEPIEIGANYKDQVEGFKIRYLSDGLKVVGFIVKPKSRGQKFPVLIYNRGGNQEFSKISQEGLTYLSYLSSVGYVVLASQYRGNDGGEGKEEFGGDDIHDVMNLIPLAKRLTYTKFKEVVMLGYSRGGMMTYIAIKEGIEIKAAAVVGGITDLIQLYNEREDEMKVVLIELIGGTPQEKEEEYKSRSAYYWPEAINVPVLILHGEADDRVNVTQAEKLADKLGELGKEFELVTYPNGDHGLNDYRADRNQRIFNWFNVHLP